ncbi:SGNH/GDSL hydrolase family protein [Thalassoroseus pseudoceratinae]|uniref:SGNH/GDSL hydrolase family protein n=1 Tax=Thalassoroseus pseudoceratinae TaxID=2713176 RepID=UPI00141E8C4F|nr:SGNH/GDSL hydrolase family protein [Thalassoroseus pseudoceratinae]
MPWRSYSASSYPLARSSRTRRRLLLIPDFGVVPHPELELEDEDDSIADEAALDQFWAGHDSREFDDDQLETLAEEDFVNISEFDETFESAELRNEQLRSGLVSENVLDEDESLHHSPSDDNSQIFDLLEEQAKRSGEQSQILRWHDSSNEGGESVFPVESTDDDRPRFPSWYVPTFRTLKRLVDDPQPATWVFTGDRLNDGNVPGGWQDFSEQFGERIRRELGRSQDVVISTSTTDGTVDELLSNLQYRVFRFRPEVVTLMLGIGDCRRGREHLDQFRASLTDLIGQIRQRGSAVVLQTPHRFDFSAHPEYASIRSYVRGIREVAQKLSIPCIDHWRHWKDIAPETQGKPEWRASDGLSPSRAGHREMARLIFKRFGIYDEASPLCSTQIQ